MHKRLLITYCLTALLLCGILLHAARTNRFCKDLGLPEANEASEDGWRSSAVEEVNRLLPSVLFF